MSDKKLLAVCMPHQGSFTQELSHLFWRMELPEGYKPLYMGARSTDVADSRNKLISAALQQRDVEWILQVDSDQAVDPSVPKRLMEHAEKNDVKILGALTFMYKRKLPIPVLPNDEDSDIGFDWVSETGLIKSDRAGTGCLLTHREVFEEVEPPWFMHEYDEKGFRLEAEDFYFSKKAIEAGYGVFIDADTVVGHIKKVDLKDYIQVLDYALQCESMDEFLRGF